MLSNYETSQVSYDTVTKTITVIIINSGYVKDTATNNNITIVHITILYKQNITLTVRVSILPHIETFENIDLNKEDALSPAKIHTLQHHTNYLKEKENDSK